ncbi:MAG TPA: hypothetical protein VE863_16370, partial [Pyrinomonadaceae bacterium]|nr:hypothetical protein [Pyrinomonadaceae bacterium]
LFLLSCALTQQAPAQSTDQSLPTPIVSNDISGKIVALDVGDPRATRHFYAFAASPGDLLITVDGKNLDGDVDVFTAITFRPLMKTTMYAGSQSPSVTKGIYLRAHQILILRIEARTPNDDPGTYHIHFGGTFEPFNGGIPVAENTQPAETSTEKADANRLSSVGATIPKPSPEGTETAETKPSPSPEKAEEKPAETPSRPTATARNNPARRGSRPSTRRQPPTKRPAPSTPTTDSAAKPETETASVEANKTKPAKIEAEKTESSKPKPEEKSSETTAPANKPKTQETSTPPAGARLIIEEKDGTRIDRPMSTVRRFMIEGATITIILKSGKIERIAMSDVTRVAIDPQQQ